MFYLSYFSVLNVVSNDCEQKGQAQYFFLLHLNLREVISIHVVIIRESMVYNYFYIFI